MVTNRDQAVSRHLFWALMMLAAVLLFSGVWWGWPSSFDSHDPTSKALLMLWNRSLDPGLRYWGAFGYQEVLLLSVIPVTIAKKFLTIDPAVAEAVMYLVTRFIWAVKALGIVAMSYVVSLELFRDRRAAAISMAMVILAPGFIAWSHIPQVDLVHAFWYTLAVMLTTLGWRRSRPLWLWYAAIAAGLAASTKYVGGVVVLAPMVAMFLLMSPAKAVWRALALGVLALLVFFITTPLATGDPVAWLPGYTADVWANNAREQFAPLAFWTMPGVLWDLYGPGTTILGLVGLSMLLIGQENRGGAVPWLLLLLSIVPYYLVFAGQHVATVRYMLPLTATLAVAAGFLVSRIMDLGIVGKGVRIGLIFAATINLILVISLDLGFMTDTRVALATWMNQHAGKGDRVETLLNHRPYFSGEKQFEEVTRPHFQAESYQMNKDMLADEASWIRKLHEAALHWNGMGLEVLETWVQKERIWLHDKSQEFDVSPEGPLLRGSKYVVLNVNTADHYIFDWPGIDPFAPEEAEYYRSLLEQTGPYRLVAGFDPIVPKWLRYPKELWINVSPPIRVFEVIPKEQAVSQIPQ